MKKVVNACIFVATLCGTSLAGATEIYEWVDENGVKQYSQTPPTHLSAEEYSPKHVGTLSVTAPNKTKSTEEVKAEEQAESEAEMSRVKEKLAKEKERMALNCDVAKHNLKILGAVGNGKFKDDQGNVIQLTAEQQQARINEAKAQITANCE